MDVIIGIDPSLTCTGIAAIDARGAVLECGRIKSARQHEGRKLDEIERSISIAKQCDDFVREFPLVAIRAVVIETAARQVRGPRRARQGQAYYGQAVGVILAWMVCQQWPVDWVSVETWTRGKPKADRAAWVQQVCGVDLSADAGHDVSDAIGVALWWQTEHPK